MGLFTRNFYINGADEIAESNRELKYAIEKSTKELGENLKQISENDIKARNRVDISLEEYEQLKTENDDLRRKVIRMQHIYQKIGLPIEELVDGIDENSITRVYREDPCEFSRRYIISFNVDDGYLRRKGLF